jgi:hypothetical protein
MCWSPEVSALAAVGAWGVCAYLYYRNDNFDRWSAAYLFTFTLTQVVDVFLWLDEGKVGLSSCSDTNFVISKYIIPMVVFTQHFVQCYFPSDKLQDYRFPIAVAHLLPILGMMYQFQCSNLVETSHGMSICWGGHIAETYQILIHTGIVAAVFVAMMPSVVALAHVATLGAVMTFLFKTENTLALGSKWCSYCLIYSFVYLAAPYWAPRPALKGKKLV